MMILLVFSVLRVICVHNSVFNTLFTNMLSQVQNTVKRLDRFFIRVSMGSLAQMTYNKVQDKFDPVDFSKTISFIPYQRSKPSLSKGETGIIFRQNVDCVCK